MVGQKVWDEYWPDRLYNHDGCDPDGMVVLGKTPHGELVEMNRRVAESDLTIYVNLNFVPMNGGHKSMAVGLCGYESLKAHHTPQGIVESNSFMDPPKSYLVALVQAPGRSDREDAQGLPHRDRAQQPRVRRPAVVPHQERGRLHRGRSPEVPGDEVDARQAAVRRAPRDLHAHAGGVRADRAATRARAIRRTTARVAKQNEQNCVEVDGPGRHPADRHPVHLAVQRQQQGAQPAARAGDGARLLLSHVPAPADPARGRRPHPHAPVLGQVRSGAPPELHRVLQPRS